MAELKTKEEPDDQREKAIECIQEALRGLSLDSLDFIMCTIRGMKSKD